MGAMATRTVRELNDDDIAKIADTYHAWRGEPDIGDYKDVAGFCASVKLADIQSNDFVLTPGRYVGAEEIADDGELPGDKVARLAVEIRTGFALRGQLQVAVMSALDRFEVPSNE
jgi:type I restriction enzyme M protein